MPVTIYKRAPEPAKAVKVGSVRTFLEQLEVLKRDTKYVYFYRGHDNFTYKAVPSIFRNRGWIKNENILFKELILRCPNDFPNQRTTFETLVKMQHYSLPTRLLDITSNPLIALYFACAEGSPINESGEVLIYRVPKTEIKYFDSDTVSVIANLSRRPHTFKAPAYTNVKKFNASKEIALLLHEIRSEKAYFEPKIQPAHLQSVLCVKPKMDNARIIRQDGAFFIFGISTTKMEPAKFPTNYLPPGTLSRVLVNWKEKGKILSQLESLGITQGTIFPEIDHVAAYIKKAYWEKAAS